jgi:plastocyanin
MKVPLKRPLNLFSKLRHRLSTIKWSLLLITTALFFLSMSQSGCDFSVSMTPGPSVDNPPSTAPLGSPSGPPPISSPPSQPLTQVQIPTIPPLVGVGSPSALVGVGSPSAPVGVGSPSALLGIPSVSALGLSPIATVPNKKKGGGNQGNSSPGGGKTVKVSMKRGAPTAADPSGFVFVPAKLNIQKGDTVIWSNPTNDNHTVTADDGSFDSGDFGTGKTFKQTFNQSGVTVTYKCKDHKGQIGTINVA